MDVEGTLLKSSLLKVGLFTPPLLLRRYLVFRDARILSRPVEQLFFYERVLWHPLRCSYLSFTPRTPYLFYFRASCLLFSCDLLLNTLYSQISDSLTGSVLLASSKSLLCCRVFCNFPFL